MPVFPDVDGVLFELLLVTVPRDPVDGCTGPQPTDAMDNIGSTSGRPTHLVGPCTVEAPNGRSERSAGIGGDETSRGDSEVEAKSVATSNRLGGDRTTDSGSCAFVGAVALLLSEVVGTWRDMESPLFDSAGGVAGTIKLAARALGGQTQDAETPVGRESTRSTGKPEAIKTVHHDTESKGMAEGESVEKAAAVAVTSVPATSERARGHNNRVSPVDSRAKFRGGRQEGRDASPPKSPRCGRSCGSCRGSRGPAPTEPPEQQSFSSRTGVALEGRHFGPVRADEMAPRATIVYRGMRLPFRWFRSGTARGMDEDLRELLGELDSETLRFVFSYST